MMDYYNAFDNYLFNQFLTKWSTKTDSEIWALVRHYKKHAETDYFKEFNKWFDKIHPY